MRKELLNGLTDEQKKKALACKSAEEVLAFAKAEGVELNDEQLEIVSGGACQSKGYICPECSSSNVVAYRVTSDIDDCVCKDCGHEWNAP